MTINAPTLIGEADSGASGTGSTTLTIPAIAEAIPVGTVLLFAWTTAAGSGVATGVHATTPVTPSTGAVSLQAVDACSIRASTNDLGIVRVLVTSEISAGSTITVTFRTSRSRRTVSCISLQGCNVQNIAEAASISSTPGADGATSAGTHGNSAAPAATASAAQTTPNALVIVVGSYGGTQTIVPNSPLTELNQAKTSVGSSDRGHSVAYKIVSASAAQTGSFTTNSSGGWTAALAVYPGEAEEEIATGRVDEFTAASGSASSLVIPVARAVPEGNLVVVSVAALHATATFTITDSRGNVYLIDDGPADLESTAAVANYARQGQSKLTTALQAGDSITITASGGTPTRWAGIAGVFNLPVNPSFGDVDASSTDGGILFGAPPVTTLRDDALVVGSHYMLSTGRIATALNDWNLSDKVVSTAGSGERAVIQVWKYIDTPGTLSENLIQYNSSADGGTIARVFDIPSAALLLKRWTGSAWETLTAKRWTGSAWETLTIKEL